MSACLLRAHEFNNIIISTERERGYQRRLLPAVTQTNGAGADKLSTGSTINSMVAYRVTLVVLCGLLALALADPLYERVHPVDFGRCM
jgi:hypothetical protein